MGLSIAPDLPEFIPLLEDLSCRFGEVQYFATHRVVDLHAWVKAIEGQIVRGYGWLGERGELFMDIGEMTTEEKRLGFSRFISSQTASGVWVNSDSPGEEDVMQIAGRWSINPQEIDAYDPVGEGYLGERT